MKSKLIYHKMYEGILDNIHLRQHIENRFWDIYSVHFHWENEDKKVLEDGQFCVDIYSELPWGFKDKKTRYEESLVQFKQGLFLERFLLIQSLIDKHDSDGNIWNCFSWFKKAPSTVYFGVEWLKDQNVRLEDIKISEPYPHKTLKDFVDAMHKHKKGVRDVYVTKNLILK